MKHFEPNLEIPVDLTNPGQFFACCGLLELTDRLWPGTEGWFQGSAFHMAVPGMGAEKPLPQIIRILTSVQVGNTMTQEELGRLEKLNVMSGKERNDEPGLDEEKKALEAKRRESPIVLSGALDFRVDWFLDEYSGGSRFKTWAGQQSVLDIVIAMQRGIRALHVELESRIWAKISRIGLPFNFDSDLGGQGSALDIGFSLDPLAASDSTRIDGVCSPALELLCFIGLQRFRPKEMFQEDGSRQNRFSYAAWRIPLLPEAAAPIACCSISSAHEAHFEFRLLYRTKYLKSFLPSTPVEGENDD